MKKFRTFILIFAVLIIGSLLASCVGAGAATQVQIWPGLTLDGKNQLGYVAYGNRLYEIDLNNGTEKWRFPAEPEKNLGFSAPPALTADGQLVAGAYNKTVYSVDPQNAQQNWTNTDGTNRYYAGTLALDQITYSPNIDHSLYAINGDGKLVWKYETEGPIWSTPVTDGQVIYLSGMDHFFYAFDSKTGKVIWQTEDLGGSMPGTPALTPEGKLFIGTYGNEMLALDAKTGKTIWETPVSGWVNASPLVAEGNLYVGALSGTFYALDAATGQIKWQYSVADTKDHEISGAAAVIGDTVYFGTKGGFLYALDKATGQERWNSLEKTDLSENGKSRIGKLYGPLQALGDILYVTPMGAGPLVFAIDPDGNTKWSYTPAK